MRLIPLLVQLLATTLLYSQTQPSQSSTPFQYFYRELPRNLFADAQETVHPLSLLIIGSATPPAISLSQSTWDQDLQDRAFRDSLPGFLETTGNIGGSWYLFLGLTLTS